MISVYWADLSANPRSDEDLAQPNVPLRPYRTAHLRRLSMLSKWLLDHALRSHPPHPDEPLVDLRYHSDGKPYLPSTRYTFSVSHSGQLAACVLSNRGPVGIDIQERVRLRPGNEGLFLSGAEQERTAGEDVLSLWSKKEAAFKAFGHELNARMTDFQFERVERLRCGAVTVQVVPLLTQPDYIGYVAYRTDTDDDDPVSITLDYL